MLVSASILSANFGKLDLEIESICKAGCDYIHVDVMDGHFVPNLTIGPVIVKNVAKVATKPLDIHLMVQNNSFFVDLFAQFKPRFLSFHIEEEKHPHKLIQKIRKYGIRPAIVLNPHTNPESIKYLLKDLDMVLLMSVNPGFGGQKYIDITDKIKALKKMIDTSNKNILIEVDGGVSEKNIKELKMAGVDMVVSGSYIFNHHSYENAINNLKMVSFEN